jgi:hypothetical protein
MAEHIHRWIAAAAVFVVATGVLGWRALGSSDPRKVGLTLATSDPQLMQLLAYSAPLADTIRILGIGDAAITLRQDPFGRLIAPAEQIVHQWRPCRVGGPRQSAGKSPRL